LKLVDLYTYEFYGDINADAYRVRCLQFPHLECSSGDLMVALDRLQNKVEAVIARQVADGFPVPPPPKSFSVPEGNIDAEFGVPETLP
jgi:hypothetical protein